MSTYLGLDLGGTKIKIGEVDSHGNVLKYKSYDSGYFCQRSALEIIKNSLDDYIETIGWSKERPVAMGVGLIGRVDTERGIWLQIDPNSTAPIELAKELTDIYGIPCRIDNDVKSATRAERVWGAGQYSKNFVYINIGTGIAVGTVVNGRQIRGSHFNAGETGHSTVGVNLGIKCGCGRTDCVEAIASGIGFDNCARAFKGKFKTSLHIPAEKGSRVSVDEVINLSQEGDELCSFIVDNATDALSNLIMNLVRMSDPDTVVLGGDIVANEFIFNRILDKLQPTTMRFVTNGVTITKLNPTFIGLLGAAAVAMNL